MDWRWGARANGAELHLHLLWSRAIPRRAAVITGSSSAPALDCLVTEGAVLYRSRPTPHPPPPTPADLASGAQLDILALLGRCRAPMGRLSLARENQANRGLRAYRKFRNFRRLRIVKIAATNTIRNGTDSRGTQGASTKANVGRHLTAVRGRLLRDFLGIHGRHHP